jgi:hypothetical protein
VPGLLKSTYSFSAKRPLRVSRVWDADGATGGIRRKTRCGLIGEGCGCNRAKRSPLLMSRSYTDGNNTWESESALLHPAFAVPSKSFASNEAW